MSTLLKRGCSKIIIDKRDIINRIIKIEVPDSHIPFIPVIRMTNINYLMNMVIYAEECGKSPDYEHSNIYSSFIRDMPSEPFYFILDVEDGSEMHGNRIEQWKLIRKTGTSYLTDYEGIALCTHSNVLSKHFIACEGTPARCDSESCPCIDLKARYEPRITRNAFASMHWCWAYPSCHSRF